MPKKCTSWVENLENLEDEKEKKRIKTREKWCIATRNEKMMVLIEERDNGEG